VRTGPGLAGLLAPAAVVSLLLVGLVFCGQRVLRRMLLDSGDPERQRAALLATSGKEEAPEGWRIARVFPVLGATLLLFEGTDGNPPVSLFAFRGRDVGEEACERWVKAEADPAPAVAYEMRNVRRLSRGAVQTPAGPVPYAVVQGEDRSGVQRRAIFDLRGAGLPHPSEVHVMAKPGAQVDLSAAERFLAGLLPASAASRPGGG